MTAGRGGCDLELDLAWPTERFCIPPDVNAVVNLAVHMGGKDYAAMLAAEEVNALGPLKLAHACVEAGVGHFVHVSSIYAGLDEGAPFYSIYTLSKRHAEELVRLFCRQTGLPLTVLRPAQIYGAEPLFRQHQPLLYALLDKAQRGEDIVINGKNDALRNFIHADDVAEIVARVVRQRVEGSYTCIGETNLHLSKIAGAAVAAFGSASALRFDSDKPDIPDNAFAPDDDLYRIIGYHPRITIEQGLAGEAAKRRIVA
jgi:nucleoside-diphosphate-sugar epimerase